MTQREFEVLSRAQQIYAIIKALNPAFSVNPHLFENGYTDGQRGYALLKVIDPITSVTQRSFESWSPAQQAGFIVSVVNPAYDQLTASGLEESLQLWLVASGWAMTVPRDAFLEMTRDQQLWNWFAVI